MNIHDLLTPTAGAALSASSNEQLHHHHPQQEPIAPSPLLGTPNIHSPTIHHLTYVTSPRDNLNSSSLPPPPPLSVVLQHQHLPPQRTDVPAQLPPRPEVMPMSMQIELGPARPQWVHSPPLSTLSPTPPPPPPPEPHMASPNLTSPSLLRASVAVTSTMTMVYEDEAYFSHKQQPTSTTPNTGVAATQEGNPSSVPIHADHMVGDANPSLTAPTRVGLLKRKRNVDEVSSSEPPLQNDLTLIEKQPPQQHPNHPLPKRPSRPDLPTLPPKPQSSTSQSSPPSGAPIAQPGNPKQPADPKPAQQSLSSQGAEKPKSPPNNLLPTKPKQSPALPTSLLNALSKQQQQQQQTHLGQSGILAGGGISSNASVVSPTNPSPPTNPPTNPPILFKSSTLKSSTIQKAPSTSSIVSSSNGGLPGANPILASNSNVPTSTSPINALQQFLQATGNTLSKPKDMSNHDPQRRSSEGKPLLQKSMTPTSGTLPNLPRLPGSRFNSSHSREQSPFDRRKQIEEEFPGLISGVRDFRGKLVQAMESNSELALKIANLAENACDDAKRRRVSLNDTSLSANGKQPPPAQILSATKQPDSWRFKLYIPTDPIAAENLTLTTSQTNIPVSNQIPITLSTREIIHRSGYPSFFLESKHYIKRLLPRSYFSLLHTKNVPHTFVFDLGSGLMDLKFFQEMAGLKKTAYFSIKEIGGDEEWEVHLKLSKERTNLFGYLLKASDMRHFIHEQIQLFHAHRKLPLVLDLDDTLVRVVGNEEGRYVPESQANEVPHRVKTLADGRRVVLTERVEEFLEWAQKYYEISVCSLGEQSYVEMVVQVLDPMRTRIRGPTLSARQEFLYLQTQSATPTPINTSTLNTSQTPQTPQQQQQQQQQQPLAGAVLPSWHRMTPKNLRTLYAYYNGPSTIMNGGVTLGSTQDRGFAELFEPLVVDDNVHMWPVSQQDNILVVREMRGSKVWNVQLFPVLHTVLSHIHGEFFRQLDSWMERVNTFSNSSAGIVPSISIPPPSTTIRLYKEYLRTELSRRIAEPMALLQNSSFSSSSNNEKPREAVQS